MTVTKDDLPGAGDDQLSRVGLPPPNYVATPARQQIKAGYESLAARLVDRAAEHRRHGREDRANRILGHAQKLRGRIELIEADWTEYDAEDRAAGREPY